MALGLSACTGSGGPAGDATANTVDGSLASSVEAAVNSAMELSGSTSAIVGVWQGEDAAYVQAFGEGVTPNSPIRGAQATQPVMCAALLDLVAEGKLSLDRELSEDMPRQVGIEGVTYGQLCTATSGLGDFKAGITDTFANNPTRQWPDRELLAQGLARSPLSWPGLDVHIADTNALLLGRALRMSTNTDLHQLLRDHVFSKAEMPSSYYPENPLTEMQLPGDGMTGSTRQLAGGEPLCDVDPIDASKVSPSMLAGAGATVTTANDLKNFYEHYLGGTFGEGTAGMITEAASTLNPKRDENGEPLPDEEQVEKDEAKAAAAKASERFWGFGLEKVGPLYGMSGSITGTLTAAYHDPETDYTVVVSLNDSTAGAGFVRALALQLAALSGEEVPRSADDLAAALADAAVCQGGEEEAAEGE